jgi:hypothetical protein
VGVGDVTVGVDDGAGVADPATVDVASGLTVTGTAVGGAVATPVYPRFAHAPATSSTASAINR